MRVKTIFLRLLPVLFLISLVSCSSSSSDPQGVDPDPLREPLTYYFDSALGNDDNSGASETEALQSISLLNAITLLPGDIVYITKGSSWSSWIQIDESGTAAQPIIITTYGTGARPDLHATASYKPAIALNGSYIHVRGICVSDANISSGVQFGTQSANNIVEDCEITHTGIGILCQGTGHIIRSNTIHDLIMMRDTNGGDDDYGAVGMWVNSPSSNIAIYGNRFSNCKAHSYDYGTDGGVLETWGAVSNIEFYNNYSENNNGFFEAGSAINATISNISIHHNITVNDITLFLPHASGSFAISFSGIRQ